MKRRDPKAPEPTLFDLPLREEGGPEIELDAPPPPGPAVSPPPARPPAATAPVVAPGAEAAPARSGPVLLPSPRELGAGFGRRVWAAMANLVVELALLVALITGSSWIVGAPRLAWTPPIVIFGAIFSFAYAVVPLAFWGQTPGMAWAGIVARAASGESLTFGQAARRWLGGWITALLGGLPGLFALSGRSLVDRLSGSRTLDARPAATPTARRAA